MDFLKGAALMKVEIRPLTPDRWHDVERLFGKYGASEGCWCMNWRLRNKDFKNRSNAANRSDFKEIVEEDRQPGLLAYVEEEPVGWCSIAPRLEFSERITHSHVFKPVDDKPVWSILCFYVHKDFRKRGIARQLLKAAIEYAIARGAKTLEAFPKDSTGRASDAEVYTGTVNLFQEFNFTEVRRRHPKRPIMRYEIT
ncbi:MAG TPA: GNAT family N-acetyltransferase [Bacillales bacterium]|nr:GNAT family N-acetyltransferase [Bacillales bacterium]